MYDKNQVHNLIENKKPHYTTLIDSEDQLLFELTPGKPDTKLPLPVGEPDTRPRIKHSGQKGKTCYHYALNFLRTRVGRHPDSEKHPLRKTEKIFSDRRKKITKMNDAHEQEKLIIQQLITDPNYTKHEIKTLAGAKNTYDTLNLQLPNISENSEVYDEFIKVLSLLKPFVCQEQHVQLEVYYQHRHAIKRNMINHTCLQQLQVDVEHKFNTEAQYQHVHGNKKFSDLNILEQEPILDNMIYRLYIDLFPSLSFISWHINDGFNALLETLKENGPCQTKGKFGQAYYSKHDMLALSAKVAGRVIYGWKKGARRNSFSASHSIILVGAHALSEAKQYLYFIDPLDGTDPNDCEQQRIYKMSYSTFINNLADVYGRRYQENHWPDDDQFLVCKK